MGWTSNVELMELSRRAYAGALAAIVALLGGIVLFDVWEDWQVQGEPLWLTLFENAVPLALVAVLFYAIYRLYSRVDTAYMATVTKWTAVGVVGILVLGAWVFGIQTLQSRIKPFILATQAALGGALGGLFVGYTIAQVRRARAESERERQRWEALFANTPTAIADLAVDDGDLEIASANETFESWFADGDPTGRSLDALVDLDTVDEDLGECVREDRGITTEFTYRDDDAFYYYTLRFVPYRVGDEQRRAYAIFTDITDLKRTQRELEETVADLERSNEQLEQFAYIASHDLQEPLRMVSSYVDLLASEYSDELDDEGDEYVEYAVDGAERMQAMIDGLLDYSRVTTQGEEFDAVDAAAVFERTRQDLQLLIEDTDATVTAGDLPTVTADENQLAQLFQNLVKNALKHGGEAPTIRVEAERADDEWVFSVADDGPGIPESQQDNVFEIFEQGARENEGTGMGLAICQRIVARHDGEMWLESSEGEGAAFYFSLPQE